MEEVKNNTELTDDNLLPKGCRIGCFSMLGIFIALLLLILIGSSPRNYMTFQKYRPDKKDNIIEQETGIVFPPICILGVIAFINSLLYRDSESPVLSGLFTAGITLFGLFWLVMFMPSLTVSVRRLRDAGITPWLLIIPIVLGAFTFLVLCDQALYNMDSSTPARYSFAFACIMTAISAVTIIIFIILFCKPSQP